MPLTIQYYPDAECHRVRIELQFLRELVSERDWLLTTKLYDHGRAVPSELISWPYSGLVDANYQYIEANFESHWEAAPLNSQAAFDQVEFSILPWSPNAKARRISPPMTRALIRVPQSRLKGPDFSTPASLLAARDFVEVAR